MNKVFAVLAECVAGPGGKRFKSGDVFDPAPTVAQAKRLVAAGCLPDAAIEAAAAIETEQEKAAGQDRTDAEAKAKAAAEAEAKKAAEKKA